MNRRSFFVTVAALPLLAEEKPLELTGKLVALPEKAVGLKIQEKSIAKTIALMSDDEYVTAILGDERLLGKTMQVSGAWKEKDRRLNVSHLYTVHDGKLHRITYWCDICTVGASKPGPCICCLQPVDLKEVPLDEKQ